MTKTIYNYHPQTGAFISSSIADESPLEPGIFLLPAFSTDIQPPTAKQNEVPIFDNGNWRLSPDWRGYKYWLTDGSEHTVIEIGIKPPDNALSSPPSPSAAQLWSAYQAQAQVKLNESNATILLCVESAVPVPAEWAAYRKALRAIVSAAGGDSTKPLPEQPQKYPEGT